MFILNLQNCFCITYLQHYHSFNDKDQPNTKFNHVKDPLKVPSGSITKARANKLKKVLNELV